MAETYTLFLFFLAEMKAGGAQKLLSFVKPKERERITDLIKKKLEMLKFEQLWLKVKIVKETCLFHFGKL